jgi:hypothetical protein
MTEDKPIVTNADIREMIDKLNAPSRRRGVSTAMIAYISTPELKAAEVCLAVSVTKVHWCEEHKRHAPRKRRALAKPKEDAK